MTVKMTRIKNVVIALLLIEFIFALMGYVFLSSNTSLVLATYKECYCSRIYLLFIKFG